MRRLALLMVLVLVGCVGLPEGTQPVKGFELPRYLGQWYEIARLDHSFERGLERVTADYSMREDGGVRVINRGFDPVTGEWRQAEGRAYFLQSADVGSLKVSFFGPFYGGYHILALDQRNYQYALIAGPDRSYLWLLARTPQLDERTYQALVGQARQLGFPVSQLIRVKQTGTD